MEKNKSSKQNIVFCIVFIAVLVVFTGINFAEFALGLEPDGHVKGLEKLELAQDTAVNTWGALQKLMGKKVAIGSTFYEDVTKLDNGYFTMADHDRDVTPAENGVQDASAFAGKLGADFLYVQAPGKEDSMDVLPFGAVTYAPSKADAMTEFVREQGYENICVKELLKADGDEWYSYFYHTDHHLQNKAAFITAKAIAEKINGSCEMTADDFDKTLYEDVFLGAQGRMTGRYYTGLDDYELWIPKEKGDYELSVPSQGIDRKGSFEDAFVYYENLEHYSFDYYAYYSYLHQDYDHMILMNHGNPEGKKIVMVRDSTAVPVSSFLITQCSEIHLVDLRYITADTDVYGMIEDIKPDELIYIFGPGYLGVENAVTLHGAAE
jgi:hypothetical protein